MGENRKLVFSEEIKERERNRVRRFKIIAIFITFIICIVVIPLDGLKDYNQGKFIAQNYTNIAKDIWYNGIEKVKYKELNISILDDDIKYEDIYKKGIGAIGYDKISLRIYINDNIHIIQKEDNIMIKNNINGSTTTLKFGENGEKVVNNKLSIIIQAIVLMIVFIFLCTAIIVVYENYGESRMIRDLNRLR